MITVRDQLKTIINQSVGDIISRQYFLKIRDKDNTTIKTYVQNMYKNGILQRVGRGQYKVIKKIDDIRLISYSPTRLARFKSAPISQKITLGVRGNSDFEDKINDKFDPEKRKNHNKRFVEDFFLKIATNYISQTRCLVITGPDYDRHITKLFDTIANEVYVCEYAPGIMRQIEDTASTCPHFQQGQIKFLNCPVQDIMVDKCQYIDLDLMATLINVRSVIAKHIKLQSFVVEGIKVIIFSAGVRNDGQGLVRFKILHDLLSTSLNAKLMGFDGIPCGFGKGVILDGIKTGSGINCTKHVPNFKDSGRIIDFQYFNYADDCPMITAIIVYK